MDYYKILGVEKTATQEEIKKAYRKLAMQFHPDRNPGDKDAERQFKEVQTAYDALSDPTTKARYDSGSTRTTGNPFTGSPFGAGFWDNPVHKTGAPIERGRNIQINVEIELKDVLNGIAKTVTVPRRVRCDKCGSQGYTEHKPCAACHGSGKTAIKQSPFNIWMTCGVCRGSGRAGTIACEACHGQAFLTTGTIEMTVNIPAGVDTGHQLRLQGYGEPAKHSEGKPGDLNIVILIKDHKLFKRNGVNLSYEYPVGYSELCLGGTIEVPTLAGTAVVTIPPNTVDYTQFRMKGMGLPYFHGGKGDLIVVVKLTMPSLEVVNSNKELLNTVAQFEKDYLVKERERFKQ